MWKTIADYSDYEINEDGQIRSKERFVEYSCGWVKKHPSKIIQPHLTSNGYLFVALYKDKVKHQEKVHRLVAETFVENPDNLPCVNHKDENKLNCNYSNLEWCSITYNNSYGNRTKKVADKLTNRADQSQKIIQMDLEGNFICEFASASEASRSIGGNRTKSSNILRACDGKLTQAYGYKWKRAT